MIHPSERKLSQARAESSIAYQVKFVMSNLNHLRKLDRQGKMEKAISDFGDKVLRGESFTPAQMSYIEGIYEKTWKAANMPAVNRHIDKKRKGLRYGQA